MNTNTKPQGAAKATPSTEKMPGILIKQDRYAHDAESLRDKLIRLRDFIRRLGLYFEETDITIGEYEGNIMVLNYLIDDATLVDVEE